MLNNLCCPPRILSMLFLKVLIKMVHFYFLTSRAWSYAFQRKTSLLSLIHSGFICNYRIYHFKLNWSGGYYIDILFYPKQVHFVPVPYGMLLKLPCRSLIKFIYYLLSSVFASSTISSIRFAWALRLSAGNPCIR